MRAMLEGPLDPDRLPAQIVRLSEGRVEWILDRFAIFASFAVKCFG